jgi:uncharacterized protein YegL
MNCVIEQTVAGVNHQIKRIKELAQKYPEQEFFTSLTLFNNNISQVCTRSLPEYLRDVTFSDYIPDGSTALLDAIGMTVSEIQKEVGPEIEQDEASVIVVIITDGFENASLHFTHSKISSCIQELEKTKRWTFCFIGANLNAHEAASKLNIKEKNTMHFNFSDYFLMFNRISDSITSYVGNKEAGDINRTFFEEEENIQ